ncbi:DNA polymerase III subunit gamma/tau, partial [Luteimonas sp. SJ-92]|nr:DNA polymerase III subunit gamma/tau [Luteimonas salinisoli]
QRQPQPQPQQEAPPPIAAPVSAAAAPAVAAMEIDAQRWPDLLGGLALRGPVRELAAHTAFVGYADGVLRLALPASDDHLKTPFLIGQFAQALAPRFGGVPQIRFEAAADGGAETLHARHARQRDARQNAAESAFLDDPDVQRLMTQHGAQVVPDSIRPLDER